MKRAFILIGVISFFLLGCKETMYFAKSNKSLVHSMEAFEDYSPYGIKVLYYPTDTSIYYGNWKIFDNKENKKVLAFGEQDGGTYTITNLWESGKIKEIKKYDRNRNWTYAVIYCENGIKVREQKGKEMRSDTIYNCNGKLQYLFDRLTGNVFYFDVSGDTSIIGRYTDNYIKNGLWIYKDSEDKKTTYEIYDADGKMSYRGDSIPNWYHK